MLAIVRSFVFRLSAILDSSTVPSLIYKGAGFDPAPTFVGSSTLRGNLLIALDFGYPGPVGKLQYARGSAVRSHRVRKAKGTHDRESEGL
jgi:hypothetical protein